MSVRVRQSVSAKIRDENPGPLSVSHGRVLFPRSVSVITDSAKCMAKVHGFREKLREENIIENEIIWA